MLPPNAETDVAKALKLEEIDLAQRKNKANDICSRETEAAIARYGRSGNLSSGKFGKAIADLHIDRARRYAEAMIQSRRETLGRFPEVGTPESFDGLLRRIEEEIEAVLASIPGRLQPHMRSSNPASSANRRYELEGMKLKTSARLEVEKMRLECELLRSKTPTPENPAPVPVAVASASDGAKIPPESTKPRSGWLRELSWEFLKTGVSNYGWRAIEALAGFAFGSVPAVRAWIVAHLPGPLKSAEPHLLWILPIAAMAVGVLCRLFYRRFRGRIEA
jgi:hypothetical protein